MKILYFTDPHVMGTNPKSRKDNFPDTIISKLTEVVQIANEERFDLVLCGGDIFNIPNPAPNVVRSIAQVLGSLDASLLSVAGNHDEFGQNPETLNRTMFGVLEATGLIFKLENVNPFFLFTTENGNRRIEISGCDSRFDMDRDGNISHYMPKYPAKKNDNDIRIHVVHGFLADHKWPDGVPHTLISDILDTEADIILTGHEHGGYGVLELNGKIFCNPGALGRVSASLAEMERIPSVAVIEIGDDGKPACTIRPLKCAKPSEEVLDREALEKEIEKKQNMQSFIETLSSFTVDNLHTYEVLQKLANADNLPYEVVREAQLRLQKAEEELASDEDELRR